jgi:uncharacterized protein YbjT (DUF2867 family)
MRLRKLLVLGGTGFVGSECVALLVSRMSEDATSARIIVPSRRPARAKALAMLPTVEVPQADVHDDATLARLVAGCDAVVNLVAILHGSAAQFEHVHVALPQRLARACKAAGVQRVVHVSALGVSADAPSDYLATKQRGEDVLHAAGLALTVLRPSIVFGEGDGFLNLFAALQALAPFMPLAGANARMQPVWVRDVAAAIVRCLEDDATIGQTYELAGPHEYTLAQLVRLAGSYSGHARAVIPMPMAIGRLQAGLLSLLPGEPLMSADNLESLTVPNVATGKLPGLAALSIAPASLESIAPGYLRLGRTRMDLFRAWARRG